VRSPQHSQRTASQKLSPQSSSSSHLATKLINFMEPPLFTILRISPFAPQKFIMERLLKKLLEESIVDGDLEFLTNKILKVSVKDAGINWQLSYINNQLTVLSPKTTNTADVIISGTARTFVLLASRKEDPDTLFFRRELSIEGDTELGLEVKNLLDSIELDVLPTIFQQTLSGLGKLAADT